MNIVYKRQSENNMIIYEQAHAKINLSLDVCGKRPNGYHEVRMIMQTIDVCDDLFFEALKEGEGIVLVTDNEMLNTEQSEGTDNLIVKAVKKLSEKLARSFDVKITLSKHIPIAAGLAGGSADAAATLRGLNRLFDLKLSMEELKEVAVKIGADVPFCVEGGLCLSEGIGEILTKLNPLPSHPLVICKPNVFVSTKDVYEAFDSETDVDHPDVDSMLKAISEYDSIGVSKHLKNVLEPVTVKMHPVILEIEEKLMELGSSKAIMSGSGPTVFGLFDSTRAANEAAVKLKEQYPDYEIYSTKFFNEFKERFV